MALRSVLGRKEKPAWPKLLAKGHGAKKLKKILNCQLLPSVVARVVSVVIQLLSLYTLIYVWKRIRR